MRHFLNEVFAFSIILFLIGIGIFFGLPGLTQKIALKTFAGTLETKELTISSPTFALIEEFPVTEGQLIKKGEPIAKLKPLSSEKKYLEENNDVYLFTADQIDILSPVDAIVVGKFFAEKSTIRPEIDIVSLSPINEIKIKVGLTPNLNLEDYEGFVAQAIDGTEVKIEFLNTIPTSNTENNVLFYYAKFTDTVPIVFFVNKELTVKMSKKSQTENQTGNWLEKIKTRFPFLN